MRHHLIRVFAVAMVTGILPAQNHAEIDKLKKEIESLRKQLEAKDVEFRTLRDKAAAVAKAKAQKKKAQVDARRVVDFFVRDGGKKVPGQVLTAGYLYDAKGRVLDAKAIRALDADTKGLKFKALDEPIVGKAIPWDRLWKEIQVADKAAIKKMRERGGRSEE